MQFVLTFDTDSDEFDGRLEEAAADVLERVARDVRRGDRSGGSVRDINGNTIGRWHFGRRVRRNPARLVTIANPPGAVLSRDVLGIVYRHAADGRLYAHAFGDDAEVDTRVGHGVAFLFGGTAPRSGVELRARDNATLILRALDGRDISREF